MISPIRIIGSLVYRTREALRGNNSFINGLNNYEYKPDCFYDGEFSLWHFPGTSNEISNTLLALDKAGKSLKYPSVLNFMQVEQNIANESHTLSFNLAIVARTNSEWVTDKRDKQDFDCVLRPVYEELINQVKKYPYFLKDYEIQRRVFEVFTTGEEQGMLLKRYGDYIDAIEIHGLKVNVKELCKRDIEIINNENDLVTEKFN